MSNCSKKRAKMSNDIAAYSCEYCLKIFTRKFNLRRHLTVCPVKQEHDVKEQIKDIGRKHKEKKQKLVEKNRKLAGENSALKEKIKRMKLEMRGKDEEITELKVLSESNKVDIYDKVCSKVLDKPTVSNTSNTMNIHPKLVNLPVANIHPLTSDYVKEQVDNDSYTFDHYLKGENGLVDFIYSITMCENDDGELERSYVCTDPSRDSYHRLVETKEWQKDKGGKFVDVILDTLSDRVDNYHQKMLDERLEANSGASKPRRNLGYDPEYIYKLNTDMHSGVVQTRGKDRRTLRQRIKKETSRKITV